MGVVHHAAWPVWFELARIRYLRQKQMSYEDLEKQGYSIPVIRLEVDYLKPARFGDFIDISLQLRREGLVRFQFHYSVYLDQTLLAQGVTHHVFTMGGKPVKPPKPFLAIVWDILLIP